MSFFPTSAEPGSDEGSRLLREYFSGYSESGEPLYTGARFERLGGGGDRPEIADWWTAEDLVAVSMLGVHVPAAAARSILEDDATTLHVLLSQVRPDRDLWEAADQEIDRSSPAWELWRRLDRYHGVGWTITSKLLARKRPRLLPVLDDVVLQASGLHIDDAWTEFRAVLTDDRVKALQSLRAAAGLGPEISVLRVLDVLLWMENH